MEKVVSVRLKALIDTYKANMKEAGKATEEVAKADRWKDLGKKTAELGDSLTKRVTLPIVGVGVAATKMSMDFDRAFVNMQSLAGVAGDEIKAMKDQVLDLAGETGKAPQELAEALYFLRSSGLTAADAMDALEMSAKASAAGMGSTVDIADAVSSAMNAYAKSGLTAAEATDVLVATAREGKAEPAELAKQMGRLLPLSSELGITFQDVGAALATLSLSGNDAAASSTLLSNIMSKLLKPSQQAMESLAGVGISLEDIRGMIAEKGLLGTLETLRASLGDNGFTRFFEDAQAVQGALAITGGDIEATRERFDALNDSAGATNKAFETWADSMGARNARAWGQLQAAMIKLGDVLAPIATDLIGLLSGILDWFTKLPGPAKQAVGVLVAIAAAAGPFLSVIGRIQSLAGGAMKFGSTLMQWASGGKAFADAMNQGGIAADGMAQKAGRLKAVLGAGGLVAAITGVVLSIKAWQDANHEKSIEEAAQAWEDMGSTIEDITDKDFKFAEANGNLMETFEKLAESNATAAARFLDGARAAGVSKDTLKEMNKVLREKADADKQSAADAEKNKVVTEQGAEAFDKETTAINETVAALGTYADKLKAQFDPLFGMIDALKGNQEAQRGVTEAQAALTEAVKNHGKSSVEAAEAQRNLEDAYLEVGKSALDVTSATAGLNAAIAQNPALVNTAKDMLGQWVRQGLITKDQAAVLGAQFDKTALQAIHLGKTDPNINVSSSGISTAQSRMRELQAQLDYIAGKPYKVKVSIVGTSVGVVLPGGAKFAAAGGPVYRGEGYIVGEKGPEWFEPDQNGRIIPNHMLSTMVPQSTLGGVGAGGGVVNQYINMAGAIIASKADAERWVAQVWNRAAARNLVNVRGRPL